MVTSGVPASARPVLLAVAWTGAGLGVLRAFFSTNEIITSLMLNYVAGLLLNYLIIDSLSYWRDTTSFEGKTFPLGKHLVDAATWPSATLGIDALELYLETKSVIVSTGARPYNPFGL